MRGAVAAFLQRHRDSPTAVLWVLGSALLWQIFLAPVAGFEWDIGRHRVWMFRLVTDGIRGFYFSGVPCDYTPGYLHLLWVTGHLSRLLFPSTFDPNHPWFHVQVKLISIFCALAIAFLVYGEVVRMAGRSKALGAAFVCAFNPALWTDDAVWGQADSVAVLLALGSLSALLRGHWLGSAVLIGAAGATKPQTAMILPAISLALFARFPFRTGCRYVCVAAVVLVSAWVPFVSRLGLGAPAWVLDRYRDLAEEYPFTSLRAFSVWALDGFFLPDGGEVFGLSPARWGTVFLIIAVFLVALIFWVSRPRANAYFSLGFLTFLAAFIFSTRMHERYIYYAIPLSLLACFEMTGRVWKIAFLGLSLSGFMNMWYVLYLRYGTPQSYLFYDEVMGFFRAEMFPVAIALLNVFLFFCCFESYTRSLLGRRRKEGDGLPARGTLRA